MTKIDIFSGFLGAGKTTLIRKLIKEAYAGEKIVLIENEFGEIAVDGDFLHDAGVNITEMNSGCICCTLVGDFKKALRQVMDTYAPDRILIEPSGVGKLSDVALAVAGIEGAEIGSKVTVVDASKAKMYMRNFGEFFNDQVASADVIILSRTGNISDQKTEAAVALLKGLNEHASIVSTPWDRIDGSLIKKAMDDADSLELDLDALRREHEEHEKEHHHHDEDNEDDHEHHHHHHDEDDEDEHEHHHHHDEEGENEHEHHHHHDEDDEDEHEHHHHHHHHDADEIFQSWGLETAKKFTEESLSEKLDDLSDGVNYGIVLRAKGILDASDGDWLYFDYVPGEKNIRRGPAMVTGRFCVIGSRLQEEALKELFEVG